MKRQIFFFAILLFFYVGQGCTFTQEDYDLQEKYIERQHQEDEARTQDAIKMKW